MIIQLMIIQIIMIIMIIMIILIMIIIIIVIKGLLRRRPGTGRRGVQEYVHIYIYVHMYTSYVYT